MRKPNWKLRALLLTLALLLGARAELRLAVGGSLLVRLLAGGILLGERGAGGAEAEGEAEGGKGEQAARLQDDSHGVLPSGS